jgi:hypothetical protein
MKVLLLNAGSSSLKCTLMESDNSCVFASSLEDWAGPETRYDYAGPKRQGATPLRFLERSCRSRAASPARPEARRSGRPARSRPEAAPAHTVPPGRSCLVSDSRWSGRPRNLWLSSWHTELLLQGRLVRLHSATKKAPSGAFVAALDGDRHDLARVRFPDQLTRLGRFQLRGEPCPGLKR